MQLSESCEIPVELVRGVHFKNVAVINNTRDSGLHTYLVTWYDMTTGLGYGDIRYH